MPDTAPPKPELILDADPRQMLPAVRALADVMDRAFVIPGTRIRFGLDAVLGLLPGIGDAIGSLVGGFIIVTAHRLGVPRAVLTRMALNQGVDALIGLVPFAGDMLDVGWKSNVRNVRLLEQALADPARTVRSSRWVIAGLLLAVAAIGVGTAFLGYLVFRWLFGG